MNKFQKYLIAFALTAFAGVASAVPIKGDIGFTGAFTLDSGGNDFTAATTVQITSAKVAGSVTGDFALAGIVDGMAAAYSNFTYNPTTTPVANIWSVGGFTFDLKTMNVVTNVKSSLSLDGYGIIKSAGFTDTGGYWTFTANSAGSNMTWSSSTAPEPAITLLLATGLIGFGVARKMRKAA